MQTVLNLKSQIVKIAERVIYDESSPSCLRWSSPLKHSRRRAGDIAGSFDGYWRINTNGINTKCHRIVWFIHNGEIPEGMVIDHIDRNPLNNNINNLRCVTQAENCRNAKINESYRSTDYCGITFSSRTVDNVIYSKYTAAVSNGDGTKKQSSFSINKYGDSEALSLAVAWRNEMLKLLNNQGFGYTEDHGKPP